MEEIVTFEHTEFPSRVWHISWSRDGRYLASCGEDKVVKIWEVDFERPECSVCIALLEDAQARTLRSCEWSNDDSMIATASFDGLVVVWESAGTSHKSWSQVAQLEGHQSEVKSVAWSPLLGFIATCGRDKQIWLWELIGSCEFECVTILEGHTQDVKYVGWHPHDNILVSASYDDSIKLWAEIDDDWRCLQTLQGHGSTVWAASFNNSGLELVSCSDDKTLRFWRQRETDGQRENFEFVKSVEGLHHSSVYSIDWSLQTNKVVSGGGDNAISIVSFHPKGKQSSQQVVGSATDLDAMETFSLTDAHACDVNCVRWNPSPRRADLLASCGDDGHVKIWRSTA